MSKSAIYTANEAVQTVPIGSIINPGTTIRRFGCNAVQDGNSIVLRGAGYYNVSANFVLSGTSTGSVTIQLMRDGTAVPGAVAEANVVSGSVITLGVGALVREMCCDGSVALTFAVGGVGVDVTNASIVVDKL